MSLATSRPVLWAETQQVKEKVVREKEKAPSLAKAKAKATKATARTARTAKTAKERAKQTFIATSLRESEN